jgi:hypothetical protein
MTFKDKIRDSLYWWLGKSKPFIINEEYKLELLFIDKINNSAKIRITNLKNNKTKKIEVVNE